jgi:hypothetical protein
MKTLTLTPSRLSLNKKTITKFFPGKEVRGNNAYSNTTITVSTLAVDSF